jgi:hypothetical protein
MLSLQKWRGTITPAAAGLKAGIGKEVVYPGLGFADGIDKP